MRTAQPKRQRGVPDGVPRWGAGTEGGRRNDRPKDRQGGCCTGRSRGLGSPVPKLEHADAQGARLGRPFFITTDEGADTVGSLCQASPEAGAAWAERMGEVLARVHGIELGAHPGLVEVLEHAEIGRFWPQVRQAAKAFAEAGVFDSRDVERFLAHAPPDAAGEALCHADFSGKQCVVSEGRIAAVVDWAAAWIGDPSIDLAIAASHWDLAGVTGASEAMLAGYRRVSPLPERYESIERAARMAFLVHVVGLWHEQGASSWRAAQLGGKLDRARALFADYAQRLD